MGDVKISVVVPVFNVQDFIAESVESLCRQNFKEFEIILVDDSSPDNSIEIAENIIKEYSNVKYTIFHKKNGGLPSARNVGLKLATGDYICFIDSDDIIGPEHLSNLYDLCEQYQLKLSYTDFEYTYKNNRVGTLSSIKNDIELIPRKELLKGFLARELKIHCCSILFSREFLVENGLIFNERLRYGEDIEFMWRVFPLLERIGHVKSNSYKYLQRKNSIMTSHSNGRVIILCEEFKKLSDTSIKKYPLDNTIFNFLAGKGFLAFFRTAAETSSYSTFRELLNKVDYRNDIKKMFSFDHLTLKLLAISLYYNPFLFYNVVNIINKQKKVMSRRH